MLSGDYVENGGVGLGEEETVSGTYELQPTELPAACSSSGLYHYEEVAKGFNSTLSSNNGEVSAAALENVQYLYENGIINWPNFTVANVAVSLYDDYESDTSATKECLPHCGLCTSHAGDSTYIAFNLLVIGVLLPFIGFCGVIGNSISAVIYSRPGMRNCTTNMYLCALGCSDNAVVLTALFLFFIDSVKRHSATLSVLYGRLSPFIYPAGMMAQTCSVYFTITAGIDCFVQVCLTKELQSCCMTQKCVRRSIGAVLLFSFFYNVPHFFEAILVDCWHPQFQSRSVEVCPAPFRFNPTYVTVYYKYMYSIFLAVGPLIVLIVLNSCIILVTVYVSKKRSVISRINNHYTHPEQRRKNSATTLTVPIQRTNNATRTCARHLAANGNSKQEFTAGNGRKSSFPTTTSLSVNVAMETAFRRASTTSSAAHLRASSVASSSSIASSATSGDDNMALILVVLLFICCNTIALLINIFEAKLSAILEWRINYIIDISNLLVVFNSSFNIVIYYNFSQPFRLTFRKRFGLQKNYLSGKELSENCSPVLPTPSLKLSDSNNGFAAGSPVSLTGLSVDIAELTTLTQNVDNCRQQHLTSNGYSSAAAAQRQCGKCGRRITNVRSNHNEKFPLKTNSILRLATMDEMESDEEMETMNENEVTSSPLLFGAITPSHQQNSIPSDAQQFPIETASILCKTCGGKINHHIFTNSLISGNKAKNGRRLFYQQSPTPVAGRLMSRSLPNGNCSTDGIIDHSASKHVTSLGKSKPSSAILPRRCNGKFNSNFDVVISSSGNSTDSDLLFGGAKSDCKSQQSIILVDDYEEDTQIYLDAVNCTIDEDINGGAG